jgi:D-sedoheptulose 7-phosphate isomerase
VNNGKPNPNAGPATTAEYFAGLNRVLSQMPFEVIDEISDALFSAYSDDRTTIIFGNGGSAALASHFACDLAKGTISNGAKRFRAIALTDNAPLLTAWANDSSYEDVFAEQLQNFVRENDVVVAISGSGNSPNVLKALKAARDAGAIAIGITGSRGGKMKSLCDLCLVVPSDHMQYIEDAHLAIAHSIFTSVRRKIMESRALAALAGVL